MKLVDQTTLAEVQLPNDLMWTDELAWTPVVGTNTHTLTGALIIEQGVRLAGRPFTMRCDPDLGWVTRETVQTLLAWAGITGRKFTLVLQYPSDTRQFTVAFDHSQDPVEARPVKGFPGHELTDYFHLALKFIEVLT
jgi:hypothetical protein